MSALETSLALYQAERQIEADRPKDANAVGDFEGTVKGEWRKLLDSGLGRVRYKNKTYKAIPLGTKSIAKGTVVSLTFARGLYFADW